MSNSSYTQQQLQDAVASYADGNTSLPPLEISNDYSWWQDFVKWVQKSLDQLNLPALNHDWVESIFQLLFWILIIGACVALIFFSYKFLSTAKNSAIVSKRVKQSLDSPFELKLLDSNAAKLRQIWRNFLTSRSLSRATTPLEFWHNEALLQNTHLSPDWLYQRMFGPLTASSDEIEFTRLQLAKLSKDGN